MAQRTLVLVKPDGVKKGLKIAAMRMLQMDKALARKHYAVHDGKPFFAGLVDFITSGPIVAVVVEGEKSVEVVRKLMGETDPVKAAPGTIRGDYGLDIGENLIHGSDSEENAQVEISLFFPDLKPAK